MHKYKFFYRLEKKFLRICFIILDAELPLNIHKPDRITTGAVLAGKNTSSKQPPNMAAANLY